MGIQDWALSSRKVELPKIKIKARASISRAPALTAHTTPNQSADHAIGTIKSCDAANIIPIEPLTRPRIAGSASDIVSVLLSVVLIFMNALASAKRI